MVILLTSDLPAYWYCAAIMTNGSMCVRIRWGGPAPNITLKEETLGIEMPPPATWTT